MLAKLSAVAQAKIKINMRMEKYNIYGNVWAIQEKVLCTKWNVYNSLSWENIWIESLVKFLIVYYYENDYLKSPL